MHAHVQRMQPARIRARHPEPEPPQRQLLAGLGQVPDRRGHQAADGVVFIVAEVRAEALVEVLDGGERIDQELAVGLGRDQRLAVVGQVVLVVYLADDLLQHVLDRDQPGHAAVLVDHDRHVVARLAELAQQDVQALGFGDQHRRAQQLAHAHRGSAGQGAAQQVLGQQDAEHLVLVLAVHGEAGMAGFDHLREHLVVAGVDRQRDHLRTRDHRVAHGHARDCHRAFHGAQGVFLDQPLRLCVSQDLGQVLAGGRLA